MAGAVAACRGAWSGLQVKGAVPVLTEGQVEGLLAAVAPFQQAYLGATLARLSDSVSAAFPGGNRALPTSAELQKLIGCEAMIVV